MQNYRKAKLLAIVIVSTIVSREALPYTNYDRVNTPGGTFEYFSSSGESTSPDVRVVKSNGITESRFDFNHDGVADAIQIQNEEFEITFAWPMRRRFQKFEIKRIKSNTVSHAVYLYSERENTYQLSFYERRSVKTFYSGFDEVSGNADAPAAPKSPEPVIVQTPAAVSTDTVSGLNNLSGSHAPCSLATATGTASTGSLELARQLEIEASKLDPSAQKAVGNSCGKISAAVKNSLAVLGETSDRENPPRYLNCLKRVAVAAGIQTQILMKIKNGANQITCGENLPAGAQAQIDENGDVKLRMTSQIGAKGEAGLTSLLFHELLHSQGLEEKRVLEIVDCCASGYDPQKPQCKSGNVPSAISPKSSLIVNGRVKSIMGELYPRHLDQKFESELILKVQGLAPELGCVAASPGTDDCEKLVSNSNVKIDHAISQVCKEQEFAPAPSCSAGVVGLLVDDTTETKADTQRDAAVLPSVPRSSQNPVGVGKMTTIDITKPEQVQKAVSDSASARSIAIANAAQSLKNIDAAALPKAQAAEAVPVRAASRTSAPTQPVSPPAPVPAAPQATQPTAHVQAPATQQPAALTLTKLAAAQRGVTAQKQQAAVAREATALAPVALPVTNTSVTSTSNSPAPVSARSTRDAEISATSQGSSSIGTTRQTISLVAIGYRDGAPILKVTSSGAQIPTFQAFSGSPGAEASQGAVSASGSSAPTVSAGESTVRGSLGTGSHGRASEGNARGSSPQFASNSSGGGSGGVSATGGFSGNASAGSIGKAATSTTKGGEPTPGTNERLKNMPVNSASDVVKIVKSAGPEIYSVLNQDWFNSHLRRLSIQIVDGGNTYGEKLKPRTRWRLSALIGDGQ